MTNTKMTPREPTPEMVEAGMRSDENHRPDYAAIWRAMWDAAPVVDGWQTIASAPRDQPIWIYAPPFTDGCEKLPSIQCVCHWHPDAGFCVDELRSITHWRALPPPPDAERGA